MSDHPVQFVLVLPSLSRLSARSLASSQGAGGEAIRCPGRLRKHERGQPGQAVRFCWPNGTYQLAYRFSFRELGLIALVAEE